MGYGLGGLFRSIARSIMPMAKSGAKSLGKIALKSGTNFLGDVLSGKNVKESAKARANEASSTVKRKVANKLQSLSQTGRGKRPKRSGKKRKATTPAVRNRQTKKRRTTQVKDIFG